jgi:hypothetical protein
MDQYRKEIQQYAEEAAAAGMLALRERVRHIVKEHEFHAGVHEQIMQAALSVLASGVE